MLQVVTGWRATTLSAANAAGDKLIGRSPCAYMISGTKDQKSTMHDVEQQGGRMLLTCLTMEAQLQDTKAGKRATEQMCQSSR